MGTFYNASFNKRYREQNYRALERHATELYINSADRHRFEDEDKVFWDRALVEDNETVKPGFFFVWTPNKIEMGHYDSDQKKLIKFLAEIKAAFEKRERFVEGEK
jgi:hypothetical protein